MNNTTIEKVELVLSKISWAQQMLNSVQQQVNDPQLGNILSGIEFIIDCASSDAEALYNLVK